MGPFASKFGSHAKIYIPRTGAQVMMKVVRKPILRTSENQCFHCGKAFQRSYNLNRHVHGVVDVIDGVSEWYSRQPCDRKAAIFEVEKILQVYVNPNDGETEVLVQWKRSLIPATALSHGGSLIKRHNCDKLIKWWETCRTDALSDTEPEPTSAPRSSPRTSSSSNPVAEPDVVGDGSPSEGMFDTFDTFVTFDTFETI